MNLAAKLVYLNTAQRNWPGNNPIFIGTFSNNDLAASKNRDDSKSSEN
ncbi:MAG: hypothetical protein ACXABY_25605 [Candidatus Thorarchaeota archaeon]|jgi:hypothetical protein